ncbi:MAG TPA: DUF4157 domain-containing protein, partial [Kofleriaceae bacterium]|nr:DUF4157 domain-containing protein [Kofleriaceae bacterium]
MAPVLARQAWPGAPTPARLPSAVTSLLSSDRGSPLPDADRWSQTMGVDVSAARVLTGPAADRAAASVDARAFTLGDRMVFGEGQYAPGSSDGDRLLRHELTHVVQQGAEPVTSFDGIGVTSPGDHAEHEAHSGGDAATEVQATGPVLARVSFQTSTADYIKKYQDKILEELKYWLDRQNYYLGGRNPSQYAPWTVVGWLYPTDAALGYIARDKIDALRRFIAPTSLEDVVDRGRTMSGTTDVKHDGVSGYGSDDWMSSVTVELAGALIRRIQESVERVTPRYLAARLHAQQRAWDRDG